MVLVEQIVRQEQGEWCRRMISADSSIKQAKVQGSMATQMEGRTGVLESEIKQAAGKGNTEKKEAELADLQAKAQSATEAQMSTLADAMAKNTDEAENTGIKAEPETATTVETPASEVGQTVTQQAAIKNGSYGKLMKVYYAKQDMDICKRSGNNFPAFI